MDDALKGRILARFDGTRNAPSVTLDAMCRQLVAEQRESWAELEEASRSLANTRLRDIQCAGFSIRLLYNPGRSINTLAAVSPEKINARPCFLCAGNLPAEQKAVLYGDDFLILANPRPIIPFHLTIAHKAHRPQSIYDCMGEFLFLTRDIGPSFMTLYNGPRCGASAPDHLHFQAVPRGHMPIEKEIGPKDRFSVVSTADHVRISSGHGLGREIILIEGSTPEDVCTTLRGSIDALGMDTDRHEEPMLNIIGHYDNGTFRLVVFPRRAHRPAAFYRKDALRIMVSPAVMEMGGMIVTPSETDFNRLDAETIESIYREVSLMP
jgi:hypothetical protein